MNSRALSAEKQMAGYHFVIRNTKNTEDLGGMDFTDDAAAVAFGNGVIRDLMHWAAKPYAGWKMEIREGERTVGSVPFKANAGRSRKRSVRTVGPST
jgi:hypothetical protein